MELYYFDEFSVKEISALLEMNSNTVSTKLSRARAKFKKGDQEVRLYERNQKDFKKKKLQYRKILIKPWKMF